MFSVAVSISFAGCALFAMAMAWAAMCDMAARRIPNALTAGLAGAFLPMALLAELPIVTLGLCTLSGLAMLGLGIALYAAGLMGGGDGKLAGATALWLGPAALPQYLAYTAIIGGLLALVVLAARVAPVPPALARVRWVRLLRSPRVGVPYGVALAAAGAIALADSPLATVAGP